MAAESICRAYKGGGVKGIAHIGAASVIDLMDERYNSIAEVGTSAGAIVAAVKASKVNDDLALRVTQGFPYASILPKFDRVPLLGKIAEAVSVATSGGFLNGDALLKDIHAALLGAGAATDFGALADRATHPPPGAQPAAALYLVAHSLRHGLVIFPQAYAMYYGTTDPHQQSIALAARGSAGIPIAFAPVPIKDASGGNDFLSDGGIDAVYPYAVAQSLMAQNHPGTRVIGFFLGPPDEVADLNPHDDDFILKYGEAYIRSVESESEQVLADPHVRDNTVMINTTGIATTQFDLAGDQQTYLYSQGVLAGLEFVVRDIVPQSLSTVERDKLGAKYTECRTAVDALATAARAGKGSVQTAWLAPMAIRLDGVARNLGLPLAAPLPQRLERTL